MSRFFIVGHAAGDASLGERLSRSGEVHFLAGHRNPSLVSIAESIHLGDICSPGHAVSAAAALRPDVCFVDNNDAIAAGVVDALQAEGFLVASASSSGAEIEWNKVTGRKVVEAVAPHMNPAFAVVTDRADLTRALQQFGDLPIVIKPAGLSGGRGVKVMGQHLANREEAEDYAIWLLQNGPEPQLVLVEERISALEFTLNVLTDGASHFFSPATYDYPYRYEGDKGPGTGGMGCFSYGLGPLPFMSEALYQEACGLAADSLRAWRSLGRPYCGGFNVTFFVRGERLQVIEFNARFGDPEILNIMEILHGDLGEALISAAEGQFDADRLKIRDLKTVSVYLVAPAYPGLGTPIEFEFDVDSARGEGCSVFFGACESLGAGMYRTVGSSRVVSLVACDSTLEGAYLKVHGAIDKSFTGTSLEWRSDVGRPDAVLRLGDARA